MSAIEKALAKVPALISSKTSIILYVFLFFYLVVFAILCIVFPFLSDWIPSDRVQLILGNYTNVLSALGASIAAGGGVLIHEKLKSMHKHQHDNHEFINKRIDELHENHRNLNKQLSELHEKINKLTQHSHI
ncbi:MAG: prefoldin subunit [Bacteroidales bacterium]|jgi:hypothetical protein|nr:prefoldin subunit [Bacteroidales bacterium]